jgi:heme-degrading monooxygenase HmoA
MYARVASFEGGDEQRLRQINEERMSSGTMNLPAGSKRALVLSDEGSGKRLFITLFDSRETIAAAEQRFEQMGDEIPEEVRGQRTSIEVYEVALEEDGEGAQAARVSSFEGAPERIDEGTRNAQENVLPKARQLPGWKGFISLVDRGSGSSKLITFWESEEALRASEEQGNLLRQQAAEGGGETISGVERYEVAFNQSM